MFHIVQLALKLTMRTRKTRNVLLLKKKKKNKSVIGFGNINIGSNKLKLLLKKTLSKEKKRWFLWNAFKMHLLSQWMVL